jgi:hypothetical protein
MSQKRWIVALAIAVLLAASGGAYYWYTGTPQYALGQVKKAYETHDTDLAFKYIDFDSVFDSFWSDIQKQLTEEATKTENEWEAFGTMIGQGIVQNMKPMLKDRLKTELTDAVRNTEQVEDNNLSKLAETYSLRQEGKIAIVEGDSPLKLHLEKRSEHHWRVVAIKGWTADMGSEAATTTEQ